MAFPNETVRILYQDVHSRGKNLSPELVLNEVTSGPLLTGLLGSLYLYGADKGRRGAVGVPINVGLDDPKYAIGVYVSQKGERDVNNKVAQAVSGYYERAGKVNHGDGVIVASDELVRQWKKDGVLKVNERTSKDQSGLSKNDRAMAVKLGDEYMERTYLPTMLRVLAEFHLQSGLTPENLKSSSAPVRQVGELAEVNVSALINTKHSVNVRQEVAHRDNMRCGFAGNREGFFLRGSQFTPEDLIFLEEVVAPWRGDDLRRKVIGTDLVGVTDTTLDQRLDWGSVLKGHSFPVCNANLDGYYGTIGAIRKQLRLDSGEFDLNHIFPRGAFFNSLIIAGLKRQNGDSILGRSIDEILLWARGVNIETFLELKNSDLFNDVDGLREVLKTYLLKIDRIVNNPGNLVTMCPDCHRGIYHQDMKHKDAIAGFLVDLESGRIKYPKERKQIEDWEKEWGKNILEGRIDSRDMEYGDVFGWLHVARRMTLIGRKPYWMSGFTPPMADAARVRTRNMIRERVGRITDDMIAKGDGVDFWKRMVGLEAMIVEDFGIDRKIRRLDKFLAGLHT